MKVGGEGDGRGWDGWMASPTRWTWGWVNSRSCWWTGRPGMLQSMGSQRVKHDWVTELNWTEALEGAYRPWEQVQAGTRNYLKLNWLHTAHNNSREIPRFIFTTIIKFFIFKFFITPLIFIFITYYYLAKKKKHIFKANFIYIYFIIL